VAELAAGTPLRSQYFVGTGGGRSTVRKLPGIDLGGAIHAVAAAGGSAFSAVRSLRSRITGSHPFWIFLAPHTTGTAHGMRGPRA
jgi:hypothetical protein